MHGSNSLRVAEQLDFLRTALPDPPARVLDVGCGDGGLAAALQEHGYDVTGIDPDAEAVTRAVGRGVRAVVTDLDGFEDAEGFDAVVFSTSLHHVPELPAAMEKVGSLLASSGVLVVDEFAHDEADAATAALFYGLRDVLVASGTGAEREHQHEHEPGAAVGEPLPRWRADHEHDPRLHGGEAMLDRLGERFDVVSVSRCPYLWAYLSEIVEDTPRGDGATVAVRDLEQRLIEAGAVRALGLRVIAHRR